VPTQHQADKNHSLSIGIMDDCRGSVGGGQLVAAELAAYLSRSYQVEFIHGGETYTLEMLAKAFGLKLDNVKERIFPVQGFAYTFGLHGVRRIITDVFKDSRVLTRPYDLFIYCGIGVPPFCYARQALMYCHFPMQHSPLREYQAQAKWKLRNPVDRFLRQRTHQLLWRLRMKGYNKLIANSHYTATWIQRRWERSAEVVPPPVEATFPELKKQNSIISVGRFWGSRNGKYQLEQVAAFREFLNASGQKWKMVMIGSCYSSIDQSYLSDVQKAAEGLPITFLVNVNRETVCRALAEARIFWHTAGLAINEEETPEQAEHFGIATVEAMRAGCVPVVIASGGQREIIGKGDAGFLCKNLQEVVQNTLAVARDCNLLSRMSSQAKRRSLDFIPGAFEKRMGTIVDECLNPGKLT
jgi:glycosyltransferase involved in cell wall biosynthesis